MSDKYLLQASNIKKQYINGKNKLTILNNVNLNVKENDFICIQGVSGSGKSTLLHILGGLDKNYKGNIFLKNKNISKLKKNSLCEIRNKQIGFVFQFFHLLPEFTLLENVMMPLLIQGEKRKLAKDKAFMLLSKVSLEKRASHKPSELSGGEQQRAAIARALIHKPCLIFCDEPTGNLDEETGAQVEDLLFSLQKKEKNTIILVTHNEKLAKKAKQRYYLKHGILEKG